MLKLIGMAIVFGGLSISPALATATCSVPRSEFVFGSDAAGTMVAKSGTRCTVYINSRSALSGGTIGQQPAHGTAFFDGHQYGYQSRPGYTGPDSFSVALTGTSYRHGHSGGIALPGTTNINFSVQVLP